MHLDITDAIAIKDGNLFFLSDSNGSVPMEAGHGFGLYYNDCRFLNGYQLTIAGEKLRRPGFDAGDGKSAILDFREPDFLRVRITRVIFGDDLLFRDRITLTSLTNETAQFPLTFQFRSQFEDVFAIRGTPQKTRGKLHRPEWRNGALAFRYDGADKIARSLTIEFDPPPSQTGGDAAHYEVTLEPGASCELSIALRIREGDAPARNALVAPADSGRTTRVSTDNETLNQIINRSLSDLRILRSSLGGETYFAAGLPWYATLFGRDSIITAFQMLAFDANIAAQTLRLLAHFQGREINAWRDEEPGKILHELRVGEMAHLNEIPHTPYYGSVDATPLWLMLIGRYAAWTGDLALFRELQPNVDAALRWMDHFGDGDRDGYVEYECKSGGGLVHQGWKDSANGIVNADGSLGEPPIALIEVQAYVYHAKLEMAALFRGIGDSARADTLEIEARRLRERFNQDFWIGDGYFALALQKGKRQIDVLSSNGGHALWCGIADDDLARQTIERLLAPEMFSGWGIRTLSSAAAAYDPLGYHLGTIWPHDNSLVAAGFKNYGLDDGALRVANAMIDAASSFASYRLPELFGGLPRQPNESPVPYPIACQPQAWAAGTIPFLITTILGLKPDGFAGRLRVVRPTLPKNVNRIEIEGLRVGNEHVDLLFQREADRVAVDIARKDGNLEVIVHVFDEK